MRLRIFAFLARARQFVSSEEIFASPPRYNVPLSISNRKEKRNRKYRERGEKEIRVKSRGEKLFFSQRGREGGRVTRPRFVEEIHGR